MLKILIYLYGLNLIMIKKLCWFLVLVVLASSCLDEPECFSLNNDVVGISFRKLSDGKADTVFLYSVATEGIAGEFVSDTELTALNLPLNYYQNQTIYHFAGLGADYTLQFDYKAQAQFVSEACGERFVLSDLKATSGSFDSLRMLSTTPKRKLQAGTHLEIYRCPNTSRVELRFSQPVVITNVSTSYTNAILWSTTPVSTFAVPLDIAADKSTITFTFGNVVKKLTVSYSRTDSTLFASCGPQAVISNISSVVTETDFTSANVIRTTIQDPLLTNIEITL